MMKDWSEQRIVIVGAARQGIALARYLVRHGAQVVITDRLPTGELSAARDSLADLALPDHQIEWVCGGHPLSLLNGTDLLCVSGGVPLTIPLVIEARARGIPLSNDSQIFMDAAPCTIIGITGSAGKSTTTSLVGSIAEQAVEQRSSSRYQRIWVGGNIGLPLLNVVDDMGVEDLAVVELSSFQLEIMHSSPQVAAVINVTPNHLDRHMTMDAYMTAKARILDFQSPEDIAILGRDDRRAWSLAEKARGYVHSFGLSALPAGQVGAFISKDSVYLRSANQLGVGQLEQLQSNDTVVDVHVLTRSEITLRGEHNLQNVMAACAIAAAAGLPLGAIRTGIRNFAGMPHRLEYVRSWGGADWYNDSIATAPERSMAAIRSFDERLILLAGGRDKNLPWDEFADLVRRRVDHLIVFGEAAELITNAVALTDKNSLSITECASLYQAVQVAAQFVRSGDVVLLSPGCTSFDEFKDFEERGECFAQWVRELP